MYKVAYLEIKSWQVMSMGAEHWYATLVAYESDERVETDIETRLTTREAAHLSIKDDWNWKRGDCTSRIPSHLRAIKLGIARFEEMYPGRILILGSPSYAEPQPVIVGPKEIKVRLNALVRLLPAARSGYLKLCDRWDETVAELGIELY